MNNIVPKVRLAVGGGVLGWLITKWMMLNDYAEAVGGYENIVWPTVIGTALPIILDGLIAIGALKTPTVATPEAAKPDLSPARKPVTTDLPVSESSIPILFDDYDTPAVKTNKPAKNWFSDAELDCKCPDLEGCDYQGMHPDVMAIANDLRDMFGPIVVNSGYRCPLWNKQVGGSSTSYHVKGMAIDLRSATISPQSIYNYLTEYYPEQYGFGLYKTFIHIDCRAGVYARKSGPDAQWIQYTPKRA